MIELQGVRFAWPEGERCLDGVDLGLEAGDKVVLLGGNGSGKSTLLKLMNGLVFPSAGEVRFAGRALSRAAFRDRDWSREFRRRCVLLFQHPEAMLFNPTVREEIAYGPGKLGLPDVDGRVARWIAELGLGPLADLPPYRLSGGEKQKVALAALLALEPDLLLLDEPMANLDPRSSGWLVDFLAATPAAVVVSTHNLTMAAELARRCVILTRDGRIAFDGPVEAALGDLDLLDAAGLVHRHRHRHGAVVHSHAHVHDWE